MKIKQGDKIFPIITGDDVIVTKGSKHPGKTFDVALEEIDDELTSQKKDIEKLKSNLKYLYAYGGVGGTSSGGSGSTGGEPRLFVSLNGRQIQAGTDNIIILNEPGNYVLEGSLSNNGGNTYLVYVAYGSNLNRPIQFTLNADSRWKIPETSLRLNYNGEIIITLIEADTDMTLSEIHQQYIVNPHTFSAKFMYEYGGGYNEFSPYEYFIGNTSTENPFIDISFRIDIPNATHIEVEYDIEETEGTDKNIQFDAITSDNPITCGHGIVSFGTNTNIINNPLRIYLDNLTRKGENFTDESNNGTYTVSVKFRYMVNGSEPQIPATSFDITLIPNNLYIHVRNSDNIMYDSKEEILAACDEGKEGIPEKNINIGAYTSFFCKVFEGPMENDAKHYTLDFNVYDVIIDGEEESEILKYSATNTNVTEQVETRNSFDVAFQSKGIKKIEFKTDGKKSSAKTTMIKYVFANEPSHTVESWYPKIKGVTDVDQNTFYFRANHETNIESDYFVGLQPLETVERGNPITISGDWTSGISSNKSTTIISFGIQYSAVNEDGAKILEVYGDSTTPLIRLYSNQLFVITLDASSKKICIPTENNFNKALNDKYHLIQIVRHCLEDNNGAKKYASYLYIDGKLESNKPNIDTNPWRVKKVVFNNVNAYYNLMEIQYVNLHPASSLIGNDDRPSIMTIDEMIYQYYLAYKDIMGAGIVSEAEKAILDNMSSIKFDGTNVIVNYNFLNTVSKDMPIPTMIMEYLPSSSADAKAIIDDLFRGYNTKANDFGTKSILLHWANGSGSGFGNTSVLVPNTFVDEDGHTYSGEWEVELQGTSTMRNRIKNFTLSLKSSSSGGDKIILMSPNYDEDDPSTFLPEQKWTLKADIADSAHANNTAVGKFVNTVCTKFSTSLGLGFDSDIEPYIKNTLEGFPFLMYFKVGDDVYYLGVYNFNMGRNSYYNLGYYKNEDTRYMKDHIKDKSGDSPFRFSIGKGSIPSTLSVGEVQDNHAEFDFHQYDPSMLYGAAGTMFGTDDNITGAGDEKIYAKTTLRNFVKSVAKAGAYCFANVDKTPVPSKMGEVEGDESISNDCVKRYNYKSYIDAATGETRYREYVPDISWQFSLENGVNKWYDPNDMEHWPVDREQPLKFSEIRTNIENLLQCIWDTDAEGRIVDENEDGVNDYHFLDFTSISEYYTICMAFGLVDSVLKNMNIKSWDGHKCCVAFYDMDCAMGESNTGAEVVSYLTASDYWYSPNDKGYVEQVAIHYDYWEENIGKGFDYPSSYLFAIAKYAQAFMSERLGITLTRYPQQFWAELRTPYIEGKTSEIGEDSNLPKAGELRSADYFINKYFSSGIGKIPAYLASLNYQVKYLYYGKKIDSTGAETLESTYLANEGAFNGSRLEKVRDWLTRRLHFLDFMFNIQKIPITIGGGHQMPLANDDTLALVKQNPDVIILLDAFTTDTANGALMDSNSQPINVYAPLNTPFIINRGNKSQMFLLNARGNAANSIRINVTKSEPVNFYGSKEFTKIDMVEPFFTNANIINSNNLEEIVYGGMIVPAISQGMKITSTSVKKIKLNISSLSGTLEISSDGLYGQALTSLDVSTSGLIGRWTGLKNLQSINISSLNNEDETIYIADCPIIGNDSTISGQNPEKPTTLKTLTISGVEGDFDIRNTKMEEIDITALKDKDATISINGDYRLKTVSLTGFKSISITDCPYLETLTIGNPQVCEKLTIDISEYRPTDGRPLPNGLNKFPSTAADGVFDLTEFTNLKELSISGTGAIVIKIPNHKVSIGTLQNNKVLSFIDTVGNNSVIELTRGYSFYNCPQYCMYQSWSESGDGAEDQIDITTLTQKIYTCRKYTKICISPKCTTLAHTFDRVTDNVTLNYSSDTNYYTNTWGQKVKNSNFVLKSASTFIDRIVGNVAIDDAYIDENNIIHDTNTGGSAWGEDDYRKNITSLEGCFQNQKSISYGGGSGGGIPNLSEYKSLENISYMYDKTGVTFITSQLLSLPYEKNKNSQPEVKWEYFIGQGPVNITTDALKNISYRITGLNNFTFNVYDQSDRNTLVKSGDEKPIDDNGYLNIKDILCPKLKENPESETDYEPFTRINIITSFSINDAQWVDYRLLFELCPEVKEVSGFLNGISLKKAKLDGLFKHCTKLNTISSSINHSGDVDDCESIDLFDFFNWGQDEEYGNLYNIRSLFETPTDNKSIGFSIKKHISQEHFEYIMNTLHNYTIIERISNIFSYCTIDNYNPDYEIKLGGLGENEVMGKIRNLNSLFYHCESGNGYPLKIRRSFFEKLPNVTSLDNTFSGVKFDHMLTYDFFCKYRRKSMTVYLTPSYNTPATLNTSEYNPDSQIYTLYNCFGDAKFVGCRCWFDPDNDGYPELKPIKDSIDGFSGDIYYKNEAGWVEYNITDPDELKDTVNNFTNYIESNRIAGVNNSEINNHNINNDLGYFNNNYSSLGTPYETNAFGIYKTYCCLPPDIFYGCRYNCDLTNVFANTNIIGVIPQHLLKNCPTGDLMDMIKNTNILPNLIYHYDKNTASDPDYLALIRDIDLDEGTISTINDEDNREYILSENEEYVLFRNSNGELKKRKPIVDVHSYGGGTLPDDQVMLAKDYSKSQFVYVPQGFTIHSKLSSVFTFRYNLPKQVDLSSADLVNKGISWAEGNKGIEYSPELRPDLWPYYTQYFFTVDESIVWKNITDMSTPFISDEQDVNFFRVNDRDPEQRIISTQEPSYTNKWWVDTSSDLRSVWITKTNGLLNIFLNLCGKRNIRTGNITDFGCPINLAFNNQPSLTRFVSGILVVFLNGRVFNDSMDAGRFTTQNGSPIIDYNIGFGRNIVFPRILTEPANNQKVILNIMSESKFYNYMFPTNSLSPSGPSYISIYGDTVRNKIESGSTPKYIVRP